MTGKYFICIFPIKNKDSGGGVERRLLRTINYINKNKYDVIKVITNRNSKNLIQNLLNESINFQIIEFNDRNKFLILYSLSKILLKINYSSIHIINPTINNLILLLLIKLFKNKLYVSIVDYTHTMKKSSNIQKAINFLSFIISDKIDWLYSYYNIFWKNRLISEKSTITLCSFTNYEIFKTDGPKLNIILFSGRFVELKQPLLLLNAIYEIKDFLYYNDFKVIFLGEGYLKDEMKDFININKLHDLVEVKYSSNTSEYYKKSKIFISIQKYENYPSQSILEAIACQNLIIATDVGDTRKLLDKNNSILVNNDMNSLIDGIKFGVNNYNSYETELKLLRDKTISFHNIENSAKYYKQFYK